MKQLIATLTAMVAASPALAATGPFLSLGNTNFVVMLAFILFIALLVYLKVPGKIGEMLDKRADGIKSELDEARALREEAQTLLASYERKQKEVQDQPTGSWPMPRPKPPKPPSRPRRIWKCPSSAGSRPPRSRSPRPRPAP